MKRLCSGMKLKVIGFVFILCLCIIQVGVAQTVDASNKSDKPEIPFSIELIGQPPENPELTFTRDQKTIFNIKNNDPITYPVLVEFMAEGGIYFSFKANLNGSSTEHIQFAAPAELFRNPFQGLFKDETINGTLTLTCQPIPKMSSAAWPKKDISLKIHLKYGSETKNQLLSGIIIFIILALGGICSIFMNIWLPNIRKRLGIIAQLNELSGKIHAISNLIDSGLRVSIRVERHRLHQSLFSLWAVNPDINSVFTECGKGIEILKKRIQLIEKMDNTLKLINGQAIPPTRVNHIKTSIKQASVLLYDPNPPDSAMESAKDLIEKAAAPLEKQDQPDLEFAQKLAQKLENIKNKIEAGVKNTGPYKRFKEKLPSNIFTILDHAIAKPEDVKIEDYFSLDMNFLKLQIICEYIDLRAKNPGSKAPEEDTLEKNFMVYLRSETYEVYIEAQHIVTQLKEGILEEDIIDALTEDPENKPGAFIDMKQGVTYPFEAIQFKAHFHRPELNRSAAKNELIPVWNFGDGLSEKEWEVSHYYVKLKPYTSELSFENSKGFRIKGKDGNPIILKKEITIQNIDWKSKRLGRQLIEISSFTIALLIGLLGLVSGAKEQVLRLDIIPAFIAIFLLGFGIDVIKNMITQKQK